MQMKVIVSFESDSLSNLKNQLLEAYNTISNGGEKKEGIFTAPTSGTYVVSTGLPEGTNATQQKPEIAEFEADDIEDIQEEVDASGAKWDAEIHQANKHKTVAGLWKRKPLRSISQAAPEPFIQAPAVEIPVKLEDVVPVQYTQQAAPVVEQVTPFQLFTQPAIAQAVQETHAPVVQETPPLTETKPAIGEPPGFLSLETFKKDLPNILLKMIQEGKLTREYIGQLAAHFTVTDLWDVAKDDAKAESLYIHFINHNLIIGL